MFGCPVTAVLGHTLDRFLPASSRSTHARSVEAFGRTSTTSRSMHSPGVLTALRSDGTVFPIEATISHSLVAGQPMYTVIMRDISARLQAEAAVRASETRYRQIVETTQEGIWQTDTSNLITFANTKMTALLGYSLEEMIGTSVFTFITPEAQEQARVAIERRRQGIAEQHDITLRRSDGATVWALINATPVTDSAGKYAGALAMISDITERKRAEHVKGDLLLAHGHFW